MVSLAAIPVMLAGTGALEMLSISTDKSKLQAAVDAAALAGAGKLSVATGTTLPLVNEAAAQAGRDNYTEGNPASFDVTINGDRSSVTVIGTVEHKAVIGFLGVGDTEVSATATAEALQKTPLCVLQVNTGAISLATNATIKAPGCLIHANGSIDVAQRGMITASRIQAVGTATGPMSPQGNGGALPIGDPFEGMNLDPTSLCGASLNLPAAPLLGDTNIAPGVHCLPILAAGKTHVHLLPGDHYFVGGLIMTQNTTLDGDDVAMVFGPMQIFNFANQATVRVTARKSGRFAGFLIATTRDNTQTFKISSSNVSQLLGTVYIPNARLEVSSTGDVGQDSAWSVIVAKELVLKNAPNLVINTNYVGSGVPVPEGVGPMSVTVLSQ